MWISNKKIILVSGLVLWAFMLFWNRVLWVQVNGWWLDIPMHILGGFWAAAILIAVVESKPEIFEIKKRLSLSFILIVSFAVLIGVFWELWEYVFDYYFNVIIAQYSVSMTLSDTLGDLLSDLTGGIVAAWIYLRVLRSRI